MSTREFDVGREELRALLVLGIIGTLLAVRDVLNINLGYGITFNVIASLLMAYWGAYLLLMVIGISDDLVRLGVAKACATAAAVFFILGICAMIGMVLFTVLALVLVPLVGPITVLIVAGIALVLFTIVAMSQIISRNDESV